ncbi:MAG TPA: tetratricopeptide repeat protein [Clostridiales bacterium]|jgi:tetratricopeptide (TPR) repeat protein|nr:tetratricopeptide repeat protein [Clostridiales bacterium]HQP69680.1 tetratricopeptide repeat protein [Clostridiales bacterium]
MIKFYLFTILTALLFYACSYKNSELYDNNTKSRFQIRYDSLHQEIKLYSDQLIKSPKNIDFLVKRAIAYRRSEFFFKALQDINKAIELRPDSAALYNERGLINFFSENYDDAICDYKKAIKIDSNFVNAYINLGVTYGSKRNFNSGLYFLNKAIELDSNNYEALEHRGCCYYNLFNIDNHIQKAINDYKKVIEIKPDYAIAYFHLGSAYLFNYHYHEALSYYDKAIELGLVHEDLKYYHDIVSNEINKDRIYHEKIDQYTNTINSDTNNIDAYYERGMLYFKNSDFQKAYDDLMKYIELNNNGDKLKEAEKMSRYIKCLIEEENNTK